MTQVQPQLTRRLLAIAISAALSGQALALEAISDEDMSAATGEGIAFLPEDFSVRFNGADNTNSGAGTLDTGVIRIIPVGPLTPQAAASGAGKGDIFLYGVAISQSAQAQGATRTSADWNTRFSRPIDSWGTAANPWLLKVETENNVPDFAAPNPTANSSGSVSYLALEAPLRHVNIAPLSPDERSAYNLKAAFWADAFVRNPNVVENLTATGTQFDVGGAGRANRIRLQAIWDGFSVNGSDVRIFQTLGGAQTGVQGMSSSYNNTLGIAATLRFNGGDGSALRTTAVPPAAASVFRVSTRETSNTNLLSTPAINGGAAPEFEASEGVFIYNLNVNLILGRLYQPLTLGVAPDGRNIVMELARIPNKESIYKQMYTNYTNNNPATNGGYFGSTCNINYCGSDGTAVFQGSNSTHSSIAIGSTEYNAATRSTTAFSGAGAVGISFGSSGSAVNTGSAVIDGLLIQHLKITTRGL